MAAGAAGAGALAALYAIYGERTRVQLARFIVPVNKPGLPADGLTILHLSDLHCRAGGVIQARKLAHLKRLLADEAYDLLAVTGDLIHDAAGFPAALSLIDGLHPRLGAFSCPGNHDYCESSLWGIFGDEETRDEQVDHGLGTRVGNTAKRFADFGRKLLSNERVHLPLAYHDVAAMHEILRRHGVTPLVNQSQRLQVDGVDLWLAGVDDLWEGKPDLAQALSGVPAHALLVVLAHNPDTWLDPCVQRADLVLSGHVHGGQVRLPLLGAVHTQGTHLRRHKPDGWFQRGSARMFVSRGLGESMPVRFGAMPQAALIHLVPA